MSLPLRHPLVLAIVAVLGIAALAVHLRGAQDPLPEMAGMPFAFITASSAGYDPARVVVWRGGSTPPRSLDVDGETAWPAYRADPSIVPERDGQPYLFPMIDDGGGQRSPAIPPKGIVISGTAPGQCSPYVTPEGQEMLDAFRARHQR